jgi:hypothetical protein
MFKIKNIALILGVLVMSLGVGYLAIAWSEPSQPPPDGGTDAPLNVSAEPQIKIGGLQTGSLIVTGAVRADGNILDSDSNVIYNSSTKKIESARLPFEQGDITSDAATNVWNEGYYNVANLTPVNVKAGINFGRGEVGTYSGGLMRLCVNSDPSSCGGWFTPQLGVTYYSSCRYPSNCGYPTTCSQVVAQGVVTPSGIGLGNWQYVTSYYPGCPMSYTSSISCGGSIESQQ